jgi:hypothetical protein
MLKHFTEKKLRRLVDAFAAQTADDHTKPIRITFALIGLYLHVEKHFAGREVQRAHMFLARKRRVWPWFKLPRDRGSMTVADVIAVPAGSERDKAIHDWCASVWEAFHSSRESVVELTRKLYPDDFAA